MQTLSHKGKLVLAYLAIYVIWGSSYYAIGVAVRDIPPLATAGIRYLLAGGLLLGWCLLRGERFPHGRQWQSPVVIAVFLLTLATGTTAVACVFVPSSVVALLQAMGACWTIFWDRTVFHKTRYRLRHYLGILLGVCGVALLVVSRSGGAFSFEIAPSGVAMILFAASCWAFGSLLGKDVPAPKSSAMGSALGMLLAAPALLTLGAMLPFWGPIPPLAEIPASALGAVAYLAVFASALAFGAHCWLIRVEPPSRVATSTFVNPAIAILLGTMLGGEVLTVQMLTGAGVILLSVLMIWKK